VFVADARHMAGHLIRAASTFFTAATLLLLFSGFAARLPASPGLAMFDALAGWLLVLVTALGGSWLPLTIAEERSQGTYGLLLLTGLGPGTFLLANAVARVAVTLIAIATTIPFWFLCVTFGGLVPQQIVACAVVIATQLIVATQIGTLCAACIVGPIRLTVAAAVTVGLYAFLPTLPRGFVPILGFKGLEVILRPGFSAVGETLAWSCGALCFAALLFGASWFALSRGEAWGDQRASRAGGAWWRNQLSGRWLFPPPCRPWREAVIWKEFYAATYGWRWCLTTAFVLGPTVAVVFAAVSGSGLGTACLTTSSLLAVAVACEAAIQMFGREVRQQTWDSLRLTPHSLGQLAKKKLAGRLPDLLPATVMVIPGIVLARDDVEWLLVDVTSRPMFHALAATLAIPATGLALAVLCLRSILVHPLDAVACAIGILVVALVISFAILSGDLRTGAIFLVPGVAFGLAGLTILTVFKIRAVLDGDR